MTRLICVVPGCTHTRGVRKGEKPPTATAQWICGEHWRSIPLMRRKAYFRAVREHDRATGLTRGQKALTCHDLWEALKGAAIQRAAGL